jgi:D-arabinose 1-dehydrogenase-like Zn-dependent alcohol dehydrogenase
MTGRYVEVEPGSLRIREEEPRPRPDGWGRVRVLACGVCGTDLHLFHGMQLPRGRSYPVRPGHEVAGTVLEGELGEIRAGTSVVLHPLLPCGACSACRAGFENRCRTAHALGIDDPGGLADEVLWPLSRMVAAPGLAPVEAAVLADAVASAHHALELAAVPPGGALTVLGAGGVGTHILQLARLRDPELRLTAVVRSRPTADRLRRLQLDVELVEGLRGCGRRIFDARGSQDAVIEFGAGPEAAPEGPPMLARGGRLVLGSISPAPLDLGTTLTALVTRELQVLGSYTSTLVDLAAVTRLAAGGCLDLSASVSHVVPLEEAARAFQLLETRPAGLSRVVVTP